MKSDVVELKKFRSKEELKIKILHLLNNYKSDEEPDVILSKDDVINVLSSIICKKTE